MAFVCKTFVVLLASLHWTAGQDTSNDHDKGIETTTRLPNILDTDVNWTIGKICQLLHDLHCIRSENVYMSAGNCLIQHDNSSDTITFGLCPYSQKELSWLRSPFSVYYSLPSNRTMMEHSNLTCGPYNREGLLCSKCKPGYGPAVYSFSLMCAECSDSGVGWALYLFLVFFPITMFYFIVIIFNIRATAPPFTAFVLMCQIYCIIELIHVPLQMTLKGVQSLSVLIAVVRVLCGIWNLDFFRYLVPPFCVSSHLGNMQALNFEYLHIIYPFLLILVTFICVELHANNFTLIVLLCKPFHRVATRFRRYLDPRASIINAFSTFLLLTLSKSIVITNSSFATTHLTIPLPSMRACKSFLYADPTIRMYSKQHLPYLLGSTSLLLVFFIVPTLLLCLYPTRIFRKLLFHFLSLRWQHAVSAFIDTFQGHYKDGTNGTRDYRAASGIHLLVIFLIILISTGTYRRSFILNYIQPILVAISLFYALARPCKNNYANPIQALLYIVIAFVVFISSSIKLHMHTIPIILFMLLCALTPHILLGIYIFYKVIKRTRHNYQPL